MSNLRLKLANFLLCSFVILSLNSYAGVKEFNDRFVLVKNAQGDVIKIKDISLTYRKNLKEEIWASYDQWKIILSDYKDIANPSDELIENDFKEIFDVTEDQIDYQAKLGNIMARLQRTMGPKESKAQLDEVKEKINPILEQLENDIEKEVSLSRHQIVANLNKPGFFYKRKVLREIIRTAISQINNVIAIGPAVNWAIYFIKMYERYLFETKREHLNMLLYYLVNYQGEELGLTDTEQKKAISSVMEADISFFNIFEYFRAKKNWQSYGVSKLKKIQEKIEKRKIKYQDHFNGAFSELTSFHSETLKNNQKVLIDLYTKRSLFNGRYSFSYHYQKPKLVLAKRIYLTIMKFAYDVITLPPGVGILLDRYTSSKMVPQIRREGSLIAYFEDHGNNDMVKKLIIQSVNPVAFGFERAFGSLK